MTTTDTDLVAFFTQDHRACDRLWADIENAAERGNDTLCTTSWSTFDTTMRRHLLMEERVLFPAFELATGITQGPTSVMRHEHTQMRGMLDRMGRLAGDSDWDALVDEGDTLLILIGQHNAKEEGMLYPMTQQVLGPAWKVMASELAQY